jgi:hypothetical protein
MLNLNLFLITDGSKLNHFQILQKAILGAMGKSCFVSLLDVLYEGRF